MDSRPVDKLSNSSIEAANFVPSEVARASSPVTKWHVVIGIFVLLALFVFWFLLTSKSVQIKFTPEADSVTVSGGIAFELGGVYLLREGDYLVNASSALHENMIENIDVSDKRNQVISLAFTPLPGFLDLTLTPVDANVAIDGKTSR